MGSENISPEQRAKSLKILRIIGGLFIVALVINFGYQIWSKYYRGDARPEIRTPCNLHKGPCTVHMKDGQWVKFSITPKAIPRGKPLTLTLETHKIHPKSIHVVLIAPQSNIMSKQLDLVTSDKGVHYETTTRINKNVDPNQQWVALVVLESPPNNIAVPFRFKTDGS